MSGVFNSGDMSVYNNNFVVGDNIEIYGTSTYNDTSGGTGFDFYSPAVLMAGNFNGYKTITDAAYIDLSGSVVAKYSKPIVGGRVQNTSTGAVSPVPFRLPGTTSTIYRLMGLRTILLSSTEFFGGAHYVNSLNGLKTAIWKLDTVQNVGTQLAGVAGWGSLNTDDLGYLPGSTYYYMTMYTIRYSWDHTIELTGGVTYAAYIEGLDKVNPQYYINLPYSVWTGSIVSFNTYTTVVNNPYTQVGSYGYIQPIYWQTSA